MRCATILMCSPYYLRWVTEWRLNQHLSIISRNEKSAAAISLVGLYPSHRRSLAMRAHLRLSFYAPSGLNANGRVIIALLPLLLLLLLAIKLIEVCNMTRAPAPLTALH